VTYAENLKDENQVEKVLTCEEDVKCNQSLDYFFEIFIDNEDLNNEKYVDNTNY